MGKIKERKELCHMKILENKQLFMDCPVCDTRHYVHIIKREGEAKVKGKTVKYPETVYICQMDGRKESEFIPAAVKYTTVLADSINAVRAAGPIDTSVQMDLLTRTSGCLKELSDAMKRLSTLLAGLSEQPEGRERAVYCRDNLVPAMEALRNPVDRLEMIVDKEMWPMPSYGDMIFEV